MGRSYQLLAWLLVSFGADARMAPPSAYILLPALTGKIHAVAASADPLTNSRRLLILRPPVTQPLNHAGLTSGNRRHNSGSGANEQSQARVTLRSELPQMMVDMLIHQDRPFVRGEGTKERVRMCRAAGWSSGGETINQLAEPIALGLEIPVIFDDEFFRRGRIPAHRFVVAKSHRLDDRSQDAPNQRTRRPNFSSRHFQAQRTVRQHLRGVHFAPLPRLVGLRPRQTSLHFVDTFPRK